MVAVNSPETKKQTRNVTWLYIYISRIQVFQRVVSMVWKVEELNELFVF